MKKAIEINIENALENVKALKMSENNKQAVSKIIDGLGANLNPSCVLDNTFLESEYGNAKFIQVCASYPACKEYEAEQARRTGSIEYIEMVDILGKIKGEKDETKLKDLVKELNKLETSVKEKYENADDHILNLIISSLIGNPFKKGSLLIDGNKVDLGDADVLKSVKVDFADMPLSLKQDLLTKAIKLFDIKDAERKN